LSVMNMLGLVKYTYHTYSMLLKILAFVLYTSPLSVQALQITPTLYGPGENFSDLSCKNCIHNTKHIGYPFTLITPKVIMALNTRASGLV
jgi:hypothetical protein